jgi:hypothetical protein
MEDDLMPTRRLTIKRHFALQGGGPHVSDTTYARRIYGPDPTGNHIEAKLLDEGVIVDTFDSDGNCIATFARGWDDFVPKGNA